VILKKKLFIVVCLIKQTISARVLLFIGDKVRNTSN